MQEMKEVVKELDVGVLEKNKKINEKNAHLIQDSVQKIESAIVRSVLFRNPYLSTSTVLSAGNCRSAP